LPLNKNPQLLARGLSAVCGPSLGADLFYAFCKLFQQIFCMKSPLAAAVIATVFFAQFLGVLMLDF
jgi:hypothetical protein